MFYAGVDLGGKRSRIHVRESDGKAAYAGWASDYDDLLKKLKPWGKDLTVAFEASGEAFFVHDLLVEYVAKVKVAHPRDLRAIAHARIKNDRLDAEKLSELNRGDLIPEVWVPPAKTRDERELLLEQVRVRRAIRLEKVKMRALMRRWGRHVNWDGTWVPKVLESVAGKLPVGAAFVLRGKLSHMEWLTTYEKELKKEIRRRVPLTDRERWLCTIPGIAPHSARWLSNVLGDVSRFPDARHAASYFGLVPGERSSGGGDKRRLGSITKAGNAVGRWLLVQCAWAATRSSKKDPAQRWRKTFEKLIGRGKSKGRAAVAIANGLARVCYAILRDQRPYETREMKTPLEGKEKPTTKATPASIAP